MCVEDREYLGQKVKYFDLEKEARFTIIISNFFFFSWAKNRVTLKRFCSKVPQWNLPL